MKERWGGGEPPAATPEEKKKKNITFSLQPKKTLDIWGGVVEVEHSSRGADAKILKFPAKNNPDETAEDSEEPS